MSLTKKKLTIGEVMTSSPYCIDYSQHLFSAKKMMNKSGIRHLPVVDKGEVVGLISANDILAAEAVSGRKSSDTIKVKDLCIFEPYVVTEDQPLSKVLLHMAKAKIGSVIVVRDSKVAGIFTTIDACKLLAKLC